MPKKDILLDSDEGFPVYSGYRITSYAKEFLYQTPMLIVVARGVGGTGDVKLSPPQSWVTNLSIVLDVNDKIADKLFLRYKLNTENLKEKLNTGAAQAQITIENLKTYKVKLPPIDVQKRVSEILSAYDDLIENNRRRIQLLEQAARLLYKEWFVHLRFPGHEYLKIKNGVPEGWGEVTLSRLCIDIREQIDPSKTDSDTPYIGLEHIPRRSITLSEWGSAVEVSSSKLRFSQGDILFGKIRPYFHKVGLTLTDGITSSDAIVIRPTENWIHEYVLFLVSSDEFVAIASKTVREGSKMPRADWKFLLNNSFLLPPRELITAFASTTGPIIAQLKTLALQYRGLTKARNLLLPRFMNGDIAI